MTVLITGSSGRIGSRLVHALLARGETVRGFDLRPSGRALAGYEELIGSFDDSSVAEAALKDVTAVFHLGAFMSWLPAENQKLHAANVGGTQVIVDAAIRAGAKRFIFASSGEVYPENVPNYLPVDENHPLRPRSAYGLSKLLGEEIVSWAHRSAGLQTTILRFSHTQDATELLDPDSFFSGPRFFLHPRIRQQEAFGNVAAVAALRALDDGKPALVLACNQNGRPFRMHITDARDMLAGLLAVHDTPTTIGETYNLGSNHPVNFADVLPVMASITGLPVRVVNLPGDGVFYETSNAKLRAATGFVPVYAFDRMLEEAGAAWRARLKS
ncbi:MAG: NAD-dependent epimerase/dehydratase family protein [Beijerinckiaceae bacterium]